MTPLPPVGRQGQNAAKQQTQIVAINFRLVYGPALLAHLVVNSWCDAAAAPSSSLHRAATPTSPLPAWPLDHSGWNSRASVSCATVVCCPPTRRSRPPPRSFRSPEIFFILQPGSPGAALLGQRQVKFSTVQCQRVSECPLEGSWWAIEGSNI